MSDEAIKRALEVAARELCFGPDGEDCDKCMVPATCKQPTLRVRDAAAAIAAFLDAPPPAAATIRLYMGEVSAQGMRDIYAYHRWLAAAVRRAAGGE